MNYIPPSGLLDQIDEKDLSAVAKNFKNTPLRVGVITKIYETDDEGNITKLFPEYNVVTSEQNGEMGQGFVEYSNCLAMDSLGSIADFLEYKLRQSEGEEFRETHQFDKQNGSMVIILCLDGHSDKAIILGGLPHGKRKTKLTKDAGLHLEGEYNGLNFSVDKDGAFKIEFKSATDNTGAPQDAEAGGTTIGIEKDGSINLDTAKEVSLKLDKAAQKIDMIAATDISMTATANVVTTADGNVETTAKGDMTVTVEGGVTMTAKSAIAIESTADIEMKGANIKMESQAKLDVMAQQMMVQSPKMDIMAPGQLMVQSPQVTITSPLITLGAGGLPAPLPTTKIIGIGPFGIPVISQMVGPFSKVVLLAP